MPKAQLSGGISIYYEDSLKTHPDHAARPAILLIMGLGMQLIHWPETLVERFMQRGFRVIRMDNRDIGLSSFLDDRPTPILRCTLCSVAGLPVGRVPYTLADMANDAVGVLDACAVDRAHVMGASMGGMIGQWMAINHANRVQSLTSVMSSTSASLPPHNHRWHSRARSQSQQPPAHHHPAGVRWLPRGSWSILYMITVGRPAKTAPFDTQREHSWKVFNAIRGSANTVSQKVPLPLLLLLLLPSHLFSRNTSSLTPARIPAPSIPSAPPDKHAPLSPTRTNAPLNCTISRVLRSFCTAERTRLRRCSTVWRPRAPYPTLR